MADNWRGTAVKKDMDALETARKAGTPVEAGFFMRRRAGMADGSTALEAQSRLLKEDQDRARKQALAGAPKTISYRRN